MNKANDIKNTLQVFGCMLWTTNYKELQGNVHKWFRLVKRQRNYYVYKHATKQNKQKIYRHFLHYNRLNNDSDYRCKTPMYNFIFFNHMIQPDVTIIFSCLSPHAITDVIKVDIIMLRLRENITFPQI